MSRTLKIFLDAAIAFDEYRKYRGSNLEFVSCEEKDRTLIRLLMLESAVLSAAIDHNNSIT